MSEPSENQKARRLHEAAWPDMFANLQSAYAELTRAQLALRRRARELEDARDLFQQVVESMSEALFLLDFRGRIVRANQAACALAGRNEEGLKGCRLTEVAGMEAIPATPWELLERSPNGTVVGLEERRTGNRGRPVWLSASCALVRDNRGKITGVLVVARDITERRRLQQELQQRVAELREADRRKDEFLAMLAHELRNPLAPIVTAAAILKAQELNDSAAVRAQEILERQVRHMARMIDDLLDVSRIVRGKIELKKETVELGTLVDAAVAATRPLAERSRHQMSVVLPEQEAWLLADPTRIEQVLTNLLGNAIKYTPQGGRIRLEASLEDEHVTIRVRDSGIGMTPEMVGRVFGLFFQAEQTLDRTEGGLGIGLTLVKNLVEMHDGEVSAHSDGLGEGSEFVVRLPILTSDRVERRAPERLELPPSGLRILVVEDNRDAAESLATLLRSWGHATYLAYGGRSAIEVARQHRPEVVLLDIGLPAMSGYEVARRLRQQPDLSDTLIVAVSGYGQEEDKLASKRAGFDDHLVKPVTPDGLRALLASYEKQRQA